MKRWKTDPKHVTKKFAWGWKECYECNLEFKWTSMWSFVYRSARVVMSRFPVKPEIAQVCMECAPTIDEADLLATKHRTRAIDYNKYPPTPPTKPPKSKRPEKPPPPPAPPRKRLPKPAPPLVISKKNLHE